MGRWIIWIKYPDQAANYIKNEKREKKKNISLNKKNSVIELYIPMRYPQPNYYSVIENRIR